MLNKIPQKAGEVVQIIDAGLKMFTELKRVSNKTRNGGTKSEDLRKNEVFWDSHAKKAPKGAFL
jgi:hypothetical protein